MKSILKKRSLSGCLSKIEQGTLVCSLPRLERISFRKRL